MIMAPRYRKYVNFYPSKLSNDEDEKRLLWNALRGLAHGIAGRAVLSGMTDDKFKDAEKVRWNFPNSHSALQFQRLAAALLSGLGAKGAVKRVKHSISVFD